jgi:hypothetical protein
MVTTPSRSRISQGSPRVRSERRRDANRRQPARDAPQIGELDAREGRVLRLLIEQQHRPAVFLILLRHVIGDFGEGLGRAMPTETGIPVH